jgi:sigma-B regulation protein RsbU (phosphoserine phosphatase)
MVIRPLFAQINPPLGELTYVNAGHNPPLLYKGSSAVSGNSEGGRMSQGDGLLTPLIRTGMPLGVEPGTIYEQRAIHLSPGDFIVFYTDGVTDALNSRNEDFGMERLKNTILSARRLTAAGILDEVDKVFREFIGDSSPFDDITVMVARRI